MWYYPYNESIYYPAIKKEWTIDTCNNLFESQSSFAEWKKPGIREYILDDTTCIKFLKVHTNL